MSPAEEQSLSQERASPVRVAAINYDRTFALRVVGDSMALPHGADGITFLDGMIVIVDPEREATPGDFVIAEFADGQLTFRQLGVEEGRPALISLNPDRQQFPVLRDGFEIVGRVIDASWGGV